MTCFKGSIFFLAMTIGVGCTSGSPGNPGTTNGALADCYSPTQNLDTAYDPGAVGCACDDGAEGQCLPDSDGRDVALVCEGGRWHAVEDGPCMP